MVLSLFKTNFVLKILLTGKAYYILLYKILLTRKKTLKNVKLKKDSVTNLRIIITCVYRFKNAKLYA